MSALVIILLSFSFAKAILLAIVVGTTFLTRLSIPFYRPPIWPFGYDSSSSVFVPDGETIVEKVISALLRWDTVYFTALADRGDYIWEQEWAFGPGWPALIRFVEPYLNDYLPTTLDSYGRYVLTAIILSNCFHLLAQIPLYHLTRRLYPVNRSIAITTCILHSFTPAGVFLSSGYTESLFAFLSFSGMALFHEDYRLFPALLWSLAGTIRSNALLWTGFFAWDALNTLMSWNTRSITRTLGRLVYLGVYVIVSVVGFAWWQYSAWEQYCTSTPQQWCLNKLPLIYSYVQSHYWEVGFLRYWTSNNLGNFLLASPHLILSILATSKHIRTKHSFYTFLSNPLTPHVLALGAISTLLFTSMHVQIITRVLTAFPAIYWYVAEKVVEDLQGVWVERTKPWEGVVRVIVVFGCVGAVLYSAFLPPA